MIFLYDFEDSFTYNIYSEIRNLDSSLNVEIIGKSSILSHLQTLENEQSKVCIILGPGPGHPNQYQNLHSCLKRLMQKENVFVVGICLGHQILWSLKGAEVQKSLMPIHGQAIEYVLSDSIKEKLNLEDKIIVQRYNSLAVNLNDDIARELRDKGHLLSFANDELIMSVADNFLTYQFHPESIGTTCPSLFFKPIQNFLL